MAALCVKHFREMEREERETDPFGSLQKAAGILWDYLQGKVLADTWGGAAGKGPG